MAGGEGTRLRPLTSNQPKPMLPMANIPMMEHVVNLLRQHGFEDIVVTVAFMANAIRTYFGDGSEFGVRMVYATESTPLGTAGSVRNARDELDERFLVISGDVLTDIDLTQVVDFHDQRGGAGHPGPQGGGQPARVRHRDHRRGRVDRAVPREAHLGPGLQRHHQHRHLRARARDLRLHPRGPGRWTSPRRSFPDALAAGKALFGYVADGYWEDVGTLEAYLQSHQDILDENVAGRHRAASRSAPGCGWARGPRSTPRATVEGPAVIGDNCVIGPGARLGPVLHARAATSGSATTPSLQRSVVHDNTYLGSGVRIDGSVLGRGSRPPPGRPVRGGRGPGRRVLRRGPRRDQGRGQGLPVQDRRGRRHGQLLHRVGVDGGPVAVRPGRASQGLANVDISPELAVRLSMAWASTLEKGATVTTSRDTSRGRPGAEAGHHGRLQRGGDQRRRPRGGHRAGHPLPGHARSDAWPGSPSGWLRTTPSRWCSGSSTRRASTSTRPPSARSSGSTTARTSGGCWPGRSVTSTSRPASLEHYTAALIDSVDLSDARRAELKLVLDYSFGTASFVMPNLLAKLEAEVLVVNPYANTAGGPGLRPPGRRGPGVRPGAGLRGPPRGGARPGRRARHHRRRRGSRSSPTTRPCWSCSTLVTEADPSARVALPVAASVVAEEICQKAGAEIVWTKLSASHLMEVARTERVTLAASQSGGFIFPALPPRLRRRGHPGQPAGPADRHRPQAVRAGGRAARRPHRPPGGRTPRGTRRGWSCGPWWSGPRAATLVLVDGVKVLEDDGWALVLPDPEEPLTHVWAEAPSEAEAEARANEHAVRLGQLLR